MSDLKSQIKKLRQEGYTLREIAKIVGLKSHTNILFHLKEKGRRIYLKDGKCPHCNKVIKQQ